MLRGDIYALKLRGRGHEQQERRYGVVVQSTAMLPRSTVIIAPTSTGALSSSFRPEIEIDGALTKVLVEQLGAVDMSRLGDVAGHATPEEMWGIDDSLRAVLALR